MKKKWKEPEVEMQSDKQDVIATCSKEETRLLITGKEWTAIGDGNDCTTLQLLASNLVKWEWKGTPVYAKTVMRQLGMAEQVVEWVTKAQDENQTQEAKYILGPALQRKMLTVLNWEMGGYNSRTTVCIMLCFFSSVKRGKKTEREPKWYTFN